MARVKRRTKGERRIEGHKVQLWTDAETRKRLKVQAVVAGMSLGDYLGFIASTGIDAGLLNDLRRIAEKKGTTVKKLIHDCLQELDNDHSPRGPAPRGPGASGVKI